MSILNGRADLIQHHLAAALRELRAAADEDGTLDTFEAADLSTPISKVKDEINRRRASGGQSQ
jgi:hypothetical protein